jgi:hypothetical protein
MQDIASGGVGAGRPWLLNQDKLPKDEKLQALCLALNECGNARL